jgi:hypothetical protein
MRHSLKLALTALSALASGAALAQAGLFPDRPGGLGLRPGGEAVLPANPALGGEAVRAWQSIRSSDYKLYGGVREASRIGLQATESFGGIVYSLPRGWGSSLEAGYAQESPLAPRRYTLAGQLHAPFSEGRSLSVGIRYRVADPDHRGAPGAESPHLNGHNLAPSRWLAGVGAGSSYQLHMSYQYNVGSTVGLALGRELETHTPYLDSPLSPLYGPRQFSLTGQHWLTPSWALSYDVMSPDVMTPLRLQSLRLGVRYRF